MRQTLCSEMFGLVALSSTLVWVVAASPRKDVNYRENVLDALGSFSQPSQERSFTNLADQFLYSMTNDIAIRPMKANSALEEAKMFNPEFQILLTLIKDSDLESLYKDKKRHLTYFVPSDRAFIRSCKDIGFKGQTKTQALVFLYDRIGSMSKGAPKDIFVKGFIKKLLKYHITRGRMMFSSFRTRQKRLKTLCDEKSIASKPDAKTVLLHDRARIMRDARLVPGYVDLPGSKHSVLHVVDRLIWFDNFPAMLNSGGKKSAKHTPKRKYVPKNYPRRKQPSSHKKKASPSRSTANKNARKGVAGSCKKTKPGRRCRGAPGHAPVQWLGGCCFGKCGPNPSKGWGHWCPDNTRKGPAPSGYKKKVNGHSKNPQNAKKSQKGREHKHGHSKNNHGKGKVNPTQKGSTNRKPTKSHGQGKKPSKSGGKASKGAHGGTSGRKPNDSKHPRPASKKDKSKKDIKISTRPATVTSRSYGTSLPSGKYGHGLLSITQRVNKPGPGYKILSRLLRETGINKPLNSTKTKFTLFAPTDMAFAMSARDLGLEANSTDELFKALKEKFLSTVGKKAFPGFVTELVKYHISGTKLRSNAVKRSSSIPTLLGPKIGHSPKIPLVLQDKAPNITDALLAVKELDLLCTNGYIHNVTRVLWPVAIMPGPRKRNSSFPTVPDAGYVNGSAKRKASCFPRSATVHLPDGSLQTMGDLSAGQSVLASKRNTDIGVVHDKIFLFTHREESGLQEFVRIRSKKGHAITLTGGHYLRANGMLQTADSIKKGDVLDTLDGAAMVESTKVVMEHGLFAPHTLSGDIVVNRVFCSSYTRDVHPKFAHAVLSPFRAIVRLGLSKEPLGSVLYKSNSLVNWLPSGPNAL